MQMFDMANSQCNCWHCGLYRLFCNANSGAQVINRCINRWCTGHTVQSRASQVDGLSERRAACWSCCRHYSWHLIKHRTPIFLVQELNACVLQQTMHPPQESVHTHNLDMSYGFQSQRGRALYCGFICQSCSGGDMQAAQTAVHVGS